ncbi:hypothetical protein LTR08_008646 [Meristemomyces frigidus]|nr:hypothetical protein LTR08_008646 [Meristemomyces frigidus]
MTARGWIANTYRSISAKEEVHLELWTLVIAPHGISERFVPTVVRMRTSEGHTAFQRLVYKISSNFRRRTKQHPREAAAAAPAQTAGDMLSPRLAATPQSLPSDSMVSVTRKNGEFKALCRPGELARGWHNGAASSYIAIDDLDFERFLMILEDDHAFDRQVDRLGWKGGYTELASRQTSTIDNERQWKAVIADLLQGGLALNFVVLERMKMSR